jgi:hypothetical protein
MQLRDAKLVHHADKVTIDFSQACTDSEICRIPDNPGAASPGAGAGYRIIISIDRRF